MTTMKKGGSAWQYTESVYGKIGGQEPVSSTDHTIAMKNVAGQNFCGGVKGGRASRRARRASKRGRKGGSLLTNVAIPAVLLYANNNVRFSHKSSKRKGRKMRKTRKYSK